MKFKMVLDDAGPHNDKALTDKIDAEVHRGRVHFCIFKSPQQIRSKMTVVLDVAVP